MESEQPKPTGWGEDEDGIASEMIRDFTRRHGTLPFPKELTEGLGEPDVQPLPQTPDQPNPGK